jgi:hypothetical protein
MTRAELEQGKYYDVIAPKWARERGGLILGRPDRLGFEAYDSDGRRLGLFTTKREAVVAWWNGCSRARHDPPVMDLRGAS